jgi:uncharacterized protein (TIGR00730 family)
MAEYDDGVALGRALAQAGLGVVTGGYYGMMEAVSLGAKEAGGATIGVTVGIISERASPNAYLDEEIRTERLLHRIDKLVELSDAYVVMPGGAGTMAELAVVWNLSIIGALHGKPIVVVGDGWRHVIETMIKELTSTDEDLASVIFEPDGPAAAALLGRLLS